MTRRQLRDVYPWISVENVAQQCMRLQELELIEWVDGLPPRAFGLVRGAAFDQASLEAIGDAAQTISGAISRNYTERIALARAESTFGHRADTRFLCTTGYLDEEAWESLVPATDALLWRSLYRQIEASERLKVSKGKPIVVTTGFGCFVSPRVSPELETPVPVIKCGLLEPGSKATSDVQSTDLAKALSHPIRIAILRVLQKGPSSPSEVRDVYPEASLPTIHKHFARLEELNCIERVEERWVEGSARNRFQLRRNDWQNGSLYASLPPHLRVEVDSVLASSYVERMAEAIVAGTIASRKEAHLTWSGLRYDEQAWEELTAEIDELFRSALSLYVQTEDRHGRARQALRPVKALTPVTLGLACFESSSDSWTLSDDEIRHLLARDDAPSHDALCGYQALIATGQGEPGGAAA